MNYAVGLGRGGREGVRVQHNGGEEPPQDAIHSPFIIDINKRQRHAKGGQDKGVVLLATGR